MTTKTLIITPQGTAKEIHPDGEKRHATDLIDEGYPIDTAWNIQERWQKIEDSLKEYKIVNEPYTGETNGVRMVFIEGGYIIKVSAGTIHQCKVNEEDKTATIL